MRKKNTYQRAKSANNKVEKSMWTLSRKKTDTHTHRYLHAFPISQRLHCISSNGVKRRANELYKVECTVDHWIHIYNFTHSQVNMCMKCMMNLPKIVKRLLQWSTYSSTLLSFSMNRISRCTYFARYIMLLVLPKRMHNSWLRWRMK